MQEFGWRYWLIGGSLCSVLYFGLGLTSGVSGALGLLSGAIVYWLDAYLLRSSRKNVIDDNFQIATVHGFKVLHIAREYGLPLYHLEKCVSPSIKGQGARPIVISMYIRYGGISVHYFLHSADQNDRGGTLHLTAGADYCLSAKDIDSIEKHAAGTSSYLPEVFTGQLSRR
jgi:hypothetical protein